MSSPAASRLRRGDARQAHHEFDALAGTGAMRVDARAMALDELAHEREPDAEPARRPVHDGLELREEREESRLRFRGETDAVVPDGEHRFGALAPRLELDAAAGVRVLGGIGEEVDEDLRDAHGV